MSDKNLGPIQAQLLLEELVASREGPFKMIIVEGSRQMGKTHLKKALQEELQNHRAIIPKPTESKYID